MAEAAEEDFPEKSNHPKVNNYECAVCLQTCVHPVQLPCGHIFCFLCVKGIVHQSKKCPMCRQDIPRNFIEQPNLLPSSLPENNEGFDGGYQWFYEGRNGWWRYDPRTNEDIEQAFKSNLSEIDILICGEVYVIDLGNSVQYCKKHPLRKRNIKRDKLTNLIVKGWWQYDERTSKELETSYKEGEQACELLIAGFLYIIDLENMIQLRRNDPLRRRKIKRDFATIPKKGIAGLRTEEIADNATEYRELHVTSSNLPYSSRSAPGSPHEDDNLHVTMERIASLRLDVTNNGSDEGE